MAFGRPTNDNTTDYDKLMAAKTAQYDAFITRAEITHRDNGNLPSKEEAKFYNDAAKICEEIANMNLSQPAVKSKWDGRKDFCLDMVRTIIKTLDPNFGKKPEQAAPAQSQAGMVQKPPKPNKITQNVPGAAPSVNGPRPENIEEGDTRIATYTESGFMTLNASTDVPATTIEQWYKPKPKHNFSDVSGMEKEKEILGKIIEDNNWKELNKILKYQSQKAILFYGLPGTGKTYVIESFVSELMNNGYKYMKLKGGDIHASLVGVAEKTIETLFREAIDNQPCVVFIDEFEGVCADRNNPNIATHEKNLTVSFLQSFTYDHDIVFLAATNFPNKVDSAMLDRIYPVLVPLPDEAARTSYFGRKFDGIALDDQISYEYMAEMTDNYSYRDLDKRLLPLLLGKLQKEAIRANIVYDEDGNIDQKKTDEKAAQAINEGNLRLTREIFDEVISDFTPSDKSKGLKELQEFESNLSKIQEGN